MKKTLVLSIAVLLIVGFFALPVIADDTFVRFEGGIGVIPVSNVAQGPPVVVTRNTVRGVNPPGQIWVIAGLSANVKVDGSIQVDGRGLLRGGGNNIGTAVPNSVRATLLCENDANVQHSSDLVPLEANGDFRIDDVLTPAPPDPCENPVLLIRNAGGNWFAAGIPKLD